MTISTWRRVFQRTDAITEAVERAVEEQSAFERTHPVPFAPDQRLRALRQRFTAAFGAPPPGKAAALLVRAAVEWKDAAQAAKEAR